MRHLFLPERAEQVRGHTWFHAIIIRSGHLHNFNNAAVVAAEVGASKIAAIERPDNSADLIPTMADGQTGNGAALQMNVEAGEMFELPPGLQVVGMESRIPARQLRVIRQGCDAWNCGGPRCRHAQPVGRHDGRELLECAHRGGHRAGSMDDAAGVVHSVAAEVGFQ
jgi:hypothetical protein